MSQGIMQQIEQFEGQADTIRQNAAREARDMIKAVDEACMMQERSAAKDIRDEAQRLIDEARQSAQSEIRLLESKRASQRDGLAKDAAKRVPQAANLIFERILKGL